MYLFRSLLFPFFFKLFTFLLYYPPHFLLFLHFLDYLSLFFTSFNSLVIPSISSPAFFFIAFFLFTLFSFSSTPLPSPPYLPPPVLYSYCISFVILFIYVLLFFSQTVLAPSPSHPHPPPPSCYSFTHNFLLDFARTGAGVTGRGCGEEGRADGVKQDKRQDLKG